MDTILWEMGGECASQMESGLEEHLCADVGYCIFVCLQSWDQCSVWSELHKFFHINGHLVSKDPDDCIVSCVHIELVPKLLPCFVT